MSYPDLQEHIAKLEEQGLLSRRGATGYRGSVYGDWGKACQETEQTLREGMLLPSFQFHSCFNTNA